MLFRSLYLVHWPILVFYQYSVFRQINVLEKSILIICSTLLAYLLYRFVEVPIRKTIRLSDHSVRFTDVGLKKLVLGAALACFVLLPTMSIHASLSDGWGWRFFSDRTDRMVRELKSSHSNRQLYFETNNILPTDTGTERSTQVLIVGDSHSRNLFNALSLNSNLHPDVDIFAFVLDEICFKPRKLEIQQSLAHQLIFGKRTYVVTPECISQKEELLSGAHHCHFDWFGFNHFIFSYRRCSRRLCTLEFRYYHSSLATKS